MVNSMDPAKKRIAFIGFPDSLAAEERIDLLEKRMRDSFAHVKYCAVDNFFTGPCNNRKVSKASYVEFHTPEAANRFYNMVKGKNEAKVNVGGNELLVKLARTKLNEKRNYSLRKAEELIKSDASSKNKAVKIDWKERQVLVNNAVAFMQDKMETEGSFVVGFWALRASVARVLFFIPLKVGRAPLTMALKRDLV